MLKERTDKSATGRKLLDHIETMGFPCVGAKSALAQGNLRVVNARDVTSGWNDLVIHAELVEWSETYRRDGANAGFRSLAVVFEGPHDLAEDEFEHALWDRIQSLSDKDAWRDLPRDPSVSADPTDRHFSLSFGGQAYFVVGLHPQASRPARRFGHPTLVFNLHNQFETLRAMGRYERMRETIVKRDVALAGSVNPMLARHGEASEAAQYSGRKVSADWVCPYNEPRNS